MVYDKGVAQAIEQKYGRKAQGDDGGEVLVAEVDNEDPTHEHGHTYNFRMPALPYAQYDEFGRRIPDRKVRVKREDQDSLLLEVNDYGN